MDVSSGLLPSASRNYVTIGVEIVLRDLRQYCRREQRSESGLKVSQISWPTSSTHETDAVSNPQDGNSDNGHSEDTIPYRMSRVLITRECVLEC